jgi:hypothetical protein
VRIIERSSAQVVLARRRSSSSLAAIAIQLVVDASKVCGARRKCLAIGTFMRRSARDGALPLGLSMLVQR